MGRGWNAKDKLEPLWLTLDPPTPDEFARQVGMNVKTVYANNKGTRNLGEKNGQKIADYFGISIYDLGATRPTEQAFLMSMLGQIIAELRRTRQAVAPDLLREVSVELRGLADDFEAVAAAQADDGPPVQEAEHP